MKTLTICIPTYEMHGLGHIFLKQSFDIMMSQTFKDFDVVVSDHSKNTEIENLCNQYKDKLDMHYYKNSEYIGNSSTNINNAIKKADGKLIKILFQDDFLYDEKSLEKTVENFDLVNDGWLVSACEHTKDGKTFIRAFCPKYNYNIHLGKNTISSPSVLTIKNKTPLLFDEKLSWLMDCDYYKRCYKEFGKPKILNAITVVNRIGEHQTTNTIATEDLRFKEYKYILNKYEKGFRHGVLLVRGYMHYIMRKINEKK